jgi:phage repressor protein C with HTH and peptisase S24 domain
MSLIFKNFNETEIMNKYERLKNDLATSGTGTMKGFGNSMLPILKNGSLLTFVSSVEYEVGDIVFSKVKGRYIDAHKITKKDVAKGFMIANNHGFENGWTKIIFGKVVKAEYKGMVIYNK